METVISMLAGSGIGYLVGLLLLAFFQREIFAFLDRTVDRVRKACGLEP